MQTSAELQQKLSSHLEELSRDFTVSEIGIFGSYVRGEQKPESDLDILVNFSQPVGFITFMQLEERLQQLLGVKVDLVTRAALKPHIGARILKEVRYAH